MFTKNRLKFLFLMLVFVTSMNIAPQAQETIEITFWYTEGSIEGALYETLVANFEAANPNVDVTAQQIGYFDTEASYENALIAGTEPDVLRADVTWITKWANQKVLEPLDDYDWDQTDFIDTALRLNQWQGKTYGIPQVVDTLGIMYNKQVFSDAGITVPAGGFTFEEFAQVAYQLTNRTSTNQDDWTYGYTSAHMTYHFLPIFYGHGAKYFDPNNIAKDNIAIDSEETRNAIQYLDDLIGNVWADPAATYKGVTPARDLQTYANLNEYFMNGKVAIIQQGPWELRNILDNGMMFNKEAYEDLTGETPPSWVGPDNLGFMEVPKTVIDGETYQGMHVGGHSYVMSAKVEDENKDMTFEFMKYLGSMEATYLRAKTNHLVSPRISFYADGYDFDASDDYLPADDDFIKGFKLNLDNAFERPVHPYFITFDGFFGDEMSKHLLEDQDIETTITNTLTKWNNYFDQFGEIADQNTAVPTTIADEDGLPLDTVSLIPALFVAAIIIKRKRN
ncbi:MAG: extracellular solute-binding protein [Candidatus Heimdallarchaeota archaeon]|nr:extracellular solute-binding protein [Candidatus Heimdallarchaeota archaeon]